MARTLKAIKILAILCLITACTATAPAKKQESSRRGQLDHLIYLNDMNERAFAYHHHCLSQNEEISGKFLENFEKANHLLFDECINSLEWEGEYTFTQILARRDNIQRFLNDYYSAKGCQSPEAEISRKHYAEMSRI